MISGVKTDTFNWPYPICQPSSWCLSVAYYLNHVACSARTRVRIDNICHQSVVSLMNSVWFMFDIKSLSHLTAASPAHWHTGSAVNKPCVLWEGVQSSAVTTVSALTVLNMGDAGCSSTRAVNCAELPLVSACIGTSGQSCPGGIWESAEILYKEVPWSRTPCQWPDWRLLGPLRVVVTVRSVQRMFPHS